MNYNPSMYAPWVRVVRFKDIVSTDGIYYVVSNQNTVDTCLEFERYLNLTSDEVLDFDIVTLDSREVKLLEVMNQGLNPVFRRNGVLSINSSWAIFDMGPKTPFAIIPRYQFVTMRNRVFNADRISFLLSLLPYIVELDNYLAKDNNMFKEASPRYRASAVQEHVVKLKTQYRSSISFIGTTLFLKDSGMYDVLIDTKDSRALASLLSRLTLFTDWGSHGNF